MADSPPRLGPDRIVATEIDLAKGREARQRVRQRHRLGVAPPHPPPAKPALRLGNRVKERLVQFGNDLCLGLPTFARRCKRSRRPEPLRLGQQQGSQLLWRHERVALGRGAALLEAIRLYQRPPPAVGILQRRLGCPLSLSDVTAGTAAALCHRPSDVEHSLRVGLDRCAQHTLEMGPAGGAVPVGV